MAELATAAPFGSPREISTGSKQNIYTIRGSVSPDELFTFRSGALVGVRAGAIRMIEVVLDGTPRSDLDIVGVYDDEKGKIEPVVTVGGDDEALDGYGKSIRVHTRDGDLGEFDTGSGVNQITADDVGKPCFAKNDNTLWLTDNGGTLSFAGLVAGVTTAGKVTLRNTFDIRAAWKRSIADAIKAPSRNVRGVVTANIADLAAFTVASNDGLTYAAGEHVLLAGQTTAAQCGIYVVGTVAVGVAPLKRAPNMPSGAAYVSGSVIEVSEGTIWRGSSWKAMCTGAKVVGTDDPLFYPRKWSKTVTLASGTYLAGAGGGSEPVFLFSTTTSSVLATRNTAGGTLTLTTHYFCPVSARIAGKAGTAAVSVTASVAAGTVNTADTSTIDLVVVNW